MPQRKKKVNGSRKTGRSKTQVARERVLKEAKRLGVISSQRACVIGRWEQSWWHLNAMAKAGDLKHLGYNQWVPTSRD